MPLSPPNDNILKPLPPQHTKPILHLIIYRLHNKDNPEKTHTSSPPLSQLGALPRFILLADRHLI